ncbi:DNA-3-methyladenine glycosylase I [Planctomicrobium sp. SH668]|uniref:DNA-3-methyladenine glycosylase I n=1 Tax=Planctomicrobium sp. SH668 TaxID=3448126 RepID=UPI003F5B5385
MQKRVHSNEISRCPWAKGEQYCDYHDQEWGVPVHDDALLFEMLMLEGSQAGLSWETVLKKREAYREAYDQFDPQRMSRYTQKKFDKLMLNPGIIRNRLKIESTVRNAVAFLEIQKEFGSFDRYIWRFVGGSTIQNRWDEFKSVPTSTPESDAMSKDLKRRGFNFVGSTICYAYMQAVGMVNDHLTSCFRHSELT